jgi:hypothetical protein
MSSTSRYRHRPRESGCASTLWTCLRLRPTGERRSLLLRLGLALSAAFVVLRALNVYGDPRPWTPQHTGMLTLLSFLNTTKYPPSLAYLFMTLGPVILKPIFFIPVHSGAGLGLRAAGGVRRLGGHRARAVPGVPLVRRTQGPSP